MQNRSDRNFVNATRANRIQRTAEVESCVGFPLTDRQRDKLQELAKEFPLKSEEDVAAFALEVGVDRLLAGDEELTQFAEQPEELDGATAVSLLAHAFRKRYGADLP